MAKTSDLEDLASACTKGSNGLRRTNNLIGWNRGPGAELRSIAKALDLNDLSSLLNLRRGRPLIGWDLSRSAELGLAEDLENKVFWGLASQLAKRGEGSLICMLSRLFSDLLSVPSTRV